MKIAQGEVILFEEQMKRCQINFGTLKYFNFSRTFQG